MRGVGINGKSRGVFRRAIGLGHGSRDIALVIEVLQAG